MGLWTYFRCLKEVRSGVAHWLGMTLYLGVGSIAQHCVSDLQSGITTQSGVRWPPTPLLFSVYCVSQVRLWLCHMTVRWQGWRRDMSAVHPSWDMLVPTHWLCTHSVCHTTQRGHDSGQRLFTINPFVFRNKCLCVFVLCIPHHSNQLCVILIRGCWLLI